MLKLIALFTMVIDHLGYVFFPEQEWMRWVGRITMPIFAYAIARGFHFTRDRKRYLIQLVILALASQIPYMLLFDKGWTLNMVFPWSLAVLALMIPVKYIHFTIIGVIALVMIPMDYSAFVILLPMAIYHFWFKKRIAWLALVSALGVLALIALVSPPFQWFALAALPLIFLLEPFDRRVRLNKWLFYLFYPVHIVVLWVIVQAPMWFA